MSFDVSATVPTTLVINQNFDIDWHLESGNGAMSADQGRLAVKLPAGHQQLTLFYQPEHIVLALLMTVVGWVSFIFLWWWERLPAAGGSINSGSIEGVHDGHTAGLSLEEVDGGQPADWKR